MLTEEEIKRYRAHAQSWLHKLWEHSSVNGDTVVWHYTDGNGLLGILRAGEIWSTQASCLNDASEVRYGAKLLQGALRVERGSAAEPSAAFIDRFADALDDTDEQPNQATSSNFVACFSLLKDDLSQWRAYSGGENGYAIGVALVDLLNVDNTIFGLVNYDGELHSALAAEIARVIVESHRMGAESRTSDTLQAWEDAFFEAWNGLLSAIAAFVNIPASPLSKSLGSIMDGLRTRTWICLSSGRKERCLHVMFASSFRRAK